MKEIKITNKISESAKEYLECFLQSADAAEELSCHRLYNILFHNCVVDNNILYIPEEENELKQSIKQLTDKIELPINGVFNPEEYSHKLAKLIIEKTCENIRNKYSEYDTRALGNLYHGLGNASGWIRAIDQYNIYTSLVCFMERVLMDAPSGLWRYNYKGNPDLCIKMLMNKLFVKLLSDLYTENKDKAVLVKKLLDRFSYYIGNIIVNICSGRISPKFLYKVCAYVNHDEIIEYTDGSRLDAGYASISDICVLLCKGYDSISPVSREILYRIIN